MDRPDRIKTGRQTQTDGQTVIQYRWRQIDRQTVNRLMDGHSDIWIGRQMDKIIDREINSQPRRMGK